MDDDLNPDVAKEFGVPCYRNGKINFKAVSSMSKKELGDLIYRLRLERDALYKKLDTWNCSIYDVEKLASVNSYYYSLADLNTKQHKYRATLEEEEKYQED